MANSQAGDSPPQDPNVQNARDILFASSADMPEGTPICKGYDFSQGPSLSAMMDAALTSGFQATNLGLAIEEVNRMRNWRLSHEPVTKDTPAELRDLAVRENTRAVIFLSYTSNMISSGMREVIRFLVQHSMVDVLVTTCGGVEEDLIKCMAPFYIGDFATPGRELRSKALNRTGNLVVPNTNYCKFEQWIQPILGAMTDEQVKTGRFWTPSRMIRRLGREIDHPDSVCYWAYKNNIPLFCPAMTDGSIGDMVFFHKQERPEFILDISDDVVAIDRLAIDAPATGMIILGGGVVKHHVCNANLMRNGADFAVYINTGQEFDGSDAGARPDEAVSWGKIKLTARPVKVYADATLVFPLLVSQTFAKNFVPEAAQNGGKPNGLDHTDESKKEPAAPNGHGNGHANGHANGHTNGHC